MAKKKAIRRQQKAQILRQGKEERQRIQAMEAEEHAPALDDDDDDKASEVGYTIGLMGEGGGRLF